LKISLKSANIPTMKEFFEDLETKKDEKQARLSNVLALAFVGDSLYCSFVRVKLANDFGCKAGDLHKMANVFVKAQNQSSALQILMQQNWFNQTELDLARRARNTKLSHVAKNATLEDYRNATSFETIVGYLFFSNQKQRMTELFEVTYNLIDSQREK